MDAQVYVTVPAEAEYDALVARAETDEQRTLLRQLREGLLLDLSDLDLALRMGSRIGKGKANASADIRYVPNDILAVNVWIFVPERLIYISHFETLPATWPDLEWDESIL